MASSKSASVKLSLNPSSFLKGLKDIDKQGEKTAKRLETLFDKAIAKLEKDAVDAAKGIEKVFKSAKISINSNGLINQINKAEMRGEQAARKIGNGFKRAFSGAAGGVGHSTRQLDRAIKELERAQKRLDRAQGQSGSAKTRREAFELKTKRRGEILGAEDKGEKRDDFRGAMGGVAGGALAGAGILGGAMYGLVNNDYFRGANTVAEKANRVSIGARGAGENAVDPKKLAAEWFAITQNVKGVTADALADGVAQFVSMTGDLKTARSSIKDFAVVAAATGADVSDVAATAAAISQQFGITDPNQIKDVLASLTFQGKAGAFELKDAASLFQRLAAAGAAFGLDKSAQGVKTLGGITQIARTSTGSGEQAATAVENMLTQLVAKSDDLAAQGVQVYEGTGADKKVRNLTDILVDTVSKVGGDDIEKKNAGLNKIFGEQGSRGMKTLQSTFSDTFRNTKGSTAEKRRAGEDAMRGKLDGAINAAGAWGEVEKDAQQAQTTISANWTAAQERLSQSFSKNVVPKLTEFANTLAANPEAMEAFGKAIGLAADALVGLGSFLADLGLVNKKSYELVAKEDTAKNLRAEVDQYDNQIAELNTLRGVGPDKLEQYKKDHPEEIAQRRAQVQELMAKRDSTDRVATEFEQEAAKGNAEFKAKSQDPGTMQAMAGAFRNLFSSPMKIGNTVKVEVTNAADLKAGAAPVPGFVPRS